MSWAAVCHQCPTEGEGPAIAYGEGHHARTTEADAYKKAFEHVRETGHSAVFVMPGCYYTGDGEMPTELPGIVPPGPARSFDTVLNDVYNRFPEPLNLLLVDLADRNHERWVENDLYADRDRGLQVVREVERTGLTANQQTWAETVASVLDEPHPDYPSFEWPGPEPDRPDGEAGHEDPGEAVIEAYREHKDAMSDRKVKEMYHRLQDERNRRDSRQRRREPDA